jgi:hypothetical protein
MAYVRVAKVEDRASVKTILGGRASGGTENDWRSSLVARKSW